ncbi:MAG: hypothetical protein IJW18_06885 [Lachnospiraceae bacterium]|nr:hypothetical protein [Lachnospiraceae bacterium]
MKADTNKKKKQRIRPSFKESFKEECAKLKEMTFGEKLEYIWEYYKVHIIITAVLVFFVVSMIKVVYNNIKYESIFHCAVVNSILSTEEENYLLDGFGEYIDVDKEHETMTFDSTYIFFWDQQSFQSDTTYASRMKVAAALAAKELDIFVADKTYVESATPEEQFMDLSTTLPAELYAVVEPYVFYSADKDGEMRPFAVDLSSTHLGDGVFYQDPPYFAIVSNTQHLETAIEFLKYAFELEK